MSGQIHELYYWLQKLKMSMPFKFHTKTMLKKDIFMTGRLWQEIFIIREIINKLDARFK